MAEKVLVVEDDPFNMKVVLMSLRRNDYVLLQAKDGQEALDVAIQERPDVILMDIQLPKIDGLEVTRRLREMPDFRDVPIIALTAYAMEGDEEKAIEAGCDAYLTKPVDTRQLPEVISRILLRRRQDEI